MNINLLQIYLVHELWFYRWLRDRTDKAYQKFSYYDDLLSDYLVAKKTLDK